MSQTDKYKVNGVNERPKEVRTPLHMQRPLALEQEPGWVYFAINDLPGERSRFELAGWEAALKKDHKNYCDDHIQLGKTVGEEVQLVVNKRPGASTKTATVMRIRQELYREDFMHEQKAYSNQLKALDPSQGSVNGSSYGEFKLEFKEN